MSMGIPVLKFRFCPCSQNTGASVTTWLAADPVAVTLVEPSTTGTVFCI